MTVEAMRATPSCVRRRVRLDEKKSRPAEKVVMGPPLSAIGLVPLRRNACTTPSPALGRQLAQARPCHPLPSCLARVAQDASFVQSSLTTGPTSWRAGGRRQLDAVMAGVAGNAIAVLVAALLALPARVTGCPDPHVTVALVHGSIRRCGSPDGA